VTYYVSRKGRILNIGDIGNAITALWDQESCIVCSVPSIGHLNPGGVFWVWSFRKKAGDDSSRRVLLPGDVSCMEVLQLNCFEEKYVAAGFVNGDIQLLRAPSFEVVHTIRKPSALSVHAIHQLSDRNSFMCGYSGGLVRWHTSSDSIRGDFKQQVFEGLDSGKVELLQMRHDTRKLISRSKCYLYAHNHQASIWDIDTATLLYVIPERCILTSQFLFELGCSGFFVSLPPGELEIWDFRGEPKLLSARNYSLDFVSGFYLKNGNVLLLSQKTSRMAHHIEEHQVVK